MGSVGAGERTTGPPGTWGSGVQLQDKAANSRLRVVRKARFMAILDEVISGPGAAGSGYS
jgi:hypothetical protein